MRRPDIRLGVHTCFSSDMHLLYAHLLGLSKSVDQHHNPHKLARCLHSLSPAAVCTVEIYVENSDLCLKLANLLHRKGVYLPHPALPLARIVVYTYSRVQRLHLVWKREWNRSRAEIGSASRKDRDHSYPGGGVWMDGHQTARESR